MFASLTHRQQNCGEEKGMKERMSIYYNPRVEYQYVERRKFRMRQTVSSCQVRIGLKTENQECTEFYIKILSPFPTSTLTGTTFHFTLFWRCFTFTSIYIQIHIPLVLHEKKNFLSNSCLTNFFHSLLISSCFLHLFKAQRYFSVV